MLTPFLPDSLIVVALICPLDYRACAVAVGLDMAVPICVHIPPVCLSFPNWFRSFVSVVILHCRFLPYVTVAISPLLISIYHCLPSLLLRRTFDCLVYWATFTAGRSFGLMLGLSLLLGRSLMWNSICWFSKLHPVFAKLLFWFFKVVRISHLIIVSGIQSICLHQRVEHFI